MNCGLSLSSTYIQDQLIFYRSGEVALPRDIGRVRRRDLMVRSGRRETGRDLALTIIQFYSLVGCSTHSTSSSAWYSVVNCPDKRTHPGWKRVGLTNKNRGSSIDSRRFLAQPEVQVVCQFLRLWIGLVCLWLLYLVNLMQVLQDARRGRTCSTMYESPLLLHRQRLATHWQLLNVRIERPISILWPGDDFEFLDAPDLQPDIATCGLPSWLSVASMLAHALLGLCIPVHSITSDFRRAM